MSKRSDPVKRYSPITPSDTADLLYPGRGILLGTAGTIKVTDTDGTEVSIPLAAGVWHPMEVVRVWSTGTDAGVVSGGIYVGR